MKIIAVVTLIFLAHFSMAQSVNKTDAKGKKQGPWEQVYPKSRAFVYKGQFKDDKPVGTFTYYYPSSKVKMIIKHDEKTGRSAAILYHEDGVVYATGIYRNQLKDSIWDYYGPSGRQSLKETYLKDKLNGKTTVYYVPEEVANKRMMPAKVTNYVNGVPEGEVVEYFEGGGIKSKGKYIAGKLDGIYVINHPNGKPMIQERYKKGVRHGWCSAYNPNGAEIGKQYYYYGRLLEGAELKEKLRQMKVLGVNPNG